MKHGKKYDEFLIRESKYGRKNSYINLCHIYVYKVFSIVLKLVPIKEAAVKISSEVFVVAWRNIQKVETSEEFEKYLEKIAAVRCTHYLIANNINQLDKSGIDLLSREFNNPISILEREILTLPNNERVLIVLRDQLEMSNENINRIYKQIDSNEIFTILNNTRKTLLKKLNPEVFNQFSDEDWNSIENILQTKKEATTEQENLVNKFIEASKELLNDLFLAIVPHQEIIDNLIAYLHQEESSNKNDVLDEKDIIETEMLLEKNQQKITPKNESNNILVPKKKINFKNKYFLIVAGIILLALLFFIIPQRVIPWQIQNKTTSTTVTGNVLQNKELKVGEIIKVSKNEEKIVIKRDDLVSVEIFKNSELKISKVSGKENILELKSGSINFNSLIGSKNSFNGGNITYIIKVPNAIISTIHSHFHYYEKKWKGFKLTTEKGWLSLTTNNSTRKTYCGNNYILDYNDANQIDIPYHKKASENFINAIKEISKLPGNNNAFKYILDNAHETDALTLWHLLYIPDIGKKRLILKKLDNLLLLDITEKTADGNQISKEIKQNLLAFIKSDLLMQ